MLSYFAGFTKSEQAKREEFLNSMRSGTETIAFKYEDIKFDKIRRKRAFYQGVSINLNEEFEDKELMNFNYDPDILPIKPKEAYTSVDYKTLTKESELPSESLAADNTQPAGYVAPAGFFDYDLANPAQQKEFLDRFELIRKRTVSFKGSDKAVAVIYNPYAGKGIDLKQRIEEKLFTANIAYDLFETEAQYGPFRVALDLDMDNYKAIVAVGGDGTLNEVVNGMLARADQKTLPLAFVPNGSENDLTASLGIHSVEGSLDNLIKGEAISIDTTRVLLDRDSESGLSNDESRLASCRHMISNSSLSMPARIASSANSWKGCCGRASFSISTYLKAFSGNFMCDRFDVEIDGTRVTDETLQTGLFIVNNGKYASGGMVSNPFACVNDGLIDVTWI